MILDPPHPIWGFKLPEIKTLELSGLINRHTYIENALKRFELQDANNTKTPLPAGIHLEKSEEPVALNTKTYYQQILGTLIYAAIGTRPNIAFAATRLS